MRRVHWLMRRQHGLITRVQALELRADAEADQAGCCPLGAWQLRAPRRVRGRICSSNLGAGSARSGSRWRPTVAVSHGTAGRLRVSQARRRPRHRDRLAARAPQAPRWRSRSSVGRAVRVRSHRSTDRSRRQPSPGRSSTCRVASPRRKFGQAIDDALRRRILSLDDLRRTAGRLGSASGRSMRKVHAALALRIAGYDPLDSDLETRALRADHRGGLARPAPAVPGRRSTGIYLSTSISPIPKCGSASSSTAGSGIAPDRRSTTIAGATPR